MNSPIIFDVETQHSFQEVGGDVKKLKISVVGMYDYATDMFKAYRENDLPEFFNRLEHASYLIGFNIKKFDLPVLSPYYIGDIAQFPTLDILEEVEKKLGYRIALDDLAKATLGIQKSGHGFMAIDYFRNGEWDKLKSYCLDDVKITKELYEYGKREKKLYFLDRFGKKEIQVVFDKSPVSSNAVSLSLPF